MPCRTDLVLINPGSRTEMYGSLASTLAAIEPPVWAALLAAFVRDKGYSVSIIDAEVDNWGPAETARAVLDLDPLLAAIVVLGANPSASSTPRMPAAGAAARALKERRPDLAIAYTGLHPAALPERTLREEAADFVCQGEGFQTLAQLVEALKSGQDAGQRAVPGLWRMDGGKVASSPLPPLVDPDSLPIAAWDLLPMPRYRAHNWHCFGRLDKRQPYAVIYTSLGCPFHCNYCNIHALYNGKPGIRLRSPEQVVREIDLLVHDYGVSNIKVLDELFAINEDRVIGICDLIIQRGYDLNIWAYARVDTVSSRMLSKMKDAGINWVAYGIESASKDVRRGVSKRFEQDVIRRAIRLAREAGINIMGNFIFGLPDDDLQSMRATLDLAKEINCEYVNFYAAMAYPGSPLYDDALRAGVPLPADWQGYGQYSEDTLPLPTKHISSAEVLRFRDSAFEEYFSHPPYLQMIEQKFGREAVEHVRQMLQRKIRRKHA